MAQPFRNSTKNNEHMSHPRSQDIRRSFIKFKRFVDQTFLAKLILIVQVAYQSNLCLLLGQLGPTISRQQIHLM